MTILPTLFFMTLQKRVKILTSSMSVRMPYTGNTCKNCYMYKRFDRNTRKKLCNKCVNTLTETGVNVMFEFSSIKFQ